MEIKTGIERYEIIILFDILAKRRSEKAIFGLLKCSCALPNEKTSYATPVPEEKHEDE
jgi:hypothetical protein